MVYCVNDMIEFLRDYIVEDQVGSLANAHLAHAHGDEEGIFSDLCLKIAKKFSVAIDFAKTGHSRHLDQGERPTKYPDFMEKYEKEVFRSKKALGKMYRICTDFESANKEVSTSYKDIQVDEDLIYPGWEKYKSDALNSKKQYTNLLKSILGNYGIDHESQAFSGAFSSLHFRFELRHDRSEIEEVIIGCMRQLCKSMHKEFLEEFQYRSDVESAQVDVLKKASAWYVVTYRNANPDFLSFPWIVSKFLANIKIRKTLGNVLPFSPSIQNFDNKIIEWIPQLPTYTKSGIWNDYRILCNSHVIERALRTLMFWGYEEEIIGAGRLMYLDKFIKLFLFVAEKFNYVAKVNSFTAKSSKHYSAAALCMEFMKFCSSFRFYNVEEMLDLVPFEVYKHNKLAKKAVVTYQKFALYGKFHTLCSDLKIRQETIQMKPMFIDSKIFSSLPIKPDDLKMAAEALVKHTRAEVTLREVTQNKKVSVCAWGTERALMNLKQILNKKHALLRFLFSTGEMPPEYPYPLPSGN